MTHADLDYGPLAPVEVEFRNLLTGRTEPVATSSPRSPAAEVQRGNWPWRLYCSREARLKPVWPSSLTMVAPAGETSDECIGVAVTCPSCGEVSLNLVSGAHLDVPFYHDRVVRSVDRPFGDTRTSPSRGSTTSCTPPVSTPSAPTSSSMGQPTVPLHAAPP